MAGHAIQLKGWQMGTWFTVDKTDINDEEMELKLLLQSSGGTSVKISLDRDGLKVTKKSAILFTGSEKTPFSQIKNIYTNPEFPRCFFCTSCRPGGYLMKIIMIRCSDEMHATGIVNYYRTLAFKNPANRTTPRRTTVSVPVVRAVSTDTKDGHNEQTTTEETRLNNGDIRTNANDNDAEKMTPSPKKAETSEALNVGIGAVPENGNKIETKEENIRILSKEVEAIQELTLKKHPATISRQEYIDAHEKVHRLEKELSKQKPLSTASPPPNPQRHNMVYRQVDKSQVKKPGNTVSIYQPNHDKYLLGNDDGKFIKVSRTRAQTFTVGNVAKVPKEEKLHSILRSTKENGDVKVSTLPIKSQATSESTTGATDGVDASFPNREDAEPTEPQEPIYARVWKNRTNKNGNIQTNGDANVHVNNYDDSTPIGTPPVPHRTVTFKKWSAEVQQRPAEAQQWSAEMQLRTSKKDQRPSLSRPSRYHQAEMMSLNMHVPKRIENVYRSATLTRNWKQNEYYRPRVNANTFRDKQRVALYRETR